MPKYSFMMKCNINSPRRGLLWANLLSSLCGIHPWWKRLHAVNNSFRSALGCAERANWLNNFKCCVLCKYCFLDIVMDYYISRYTQSPLSSQAYWNRKVRHLGPLYYWRWKLAITTRWMGVTFSGFSSNVVPIEPRCLHSFRSWRFEHRWRGKFRQGVFL